MRARIGVIGTGWWATQHHIPSLLGYERAEVAGFADPNAEKLQMAARHFGVDRTFPDYHDLIGSGHVDGVVIATPHAFHYEIARDCLDAGVHVLVEKPMVLHASEAWDLVERARSRDLHLVCGYTFQFTRHAAAAKELFSSGAIGDVLLVAGVFASIVESYYRGRPDDYERMFEFPLTGPEETTYSDPKIAGGGQGHTQVTHAMGMAFWLTGRRATEVHAYMENADLAVDLADAIAYRLEGGAIGTMAATGSLRPDHEQQQDFRYYGTDGFLLQDLIHGRLSLHSNDGRSEVFPDLAEDEIYPAHAPARSLADLILGDGENRAPGEPAAATVEFLEAAYRSAAEGRPVRVEELRVAV